MKSEKGITLESLIIYIIIMTLAIGILSAISSTFYNNMQYIDSEGIFAIEYEKFNTSFIEDIKTLGMRTLEINTNQNYIIIYNDNTKEQIKYTFSSDGIYRNEAQISNKITATLKQGEDEENKNMISVLLEYKGKGSGKLDDISKVKTLEYYLPI